MNNPYSAGDTSKYPLLNNINNKETNNGFNSSPPLSMEGKSHRIQMDKKVFVNDLQY